MADRASSDAFPIPPADALVALTILGQDLRSVLVGTAGAAELGIATATDTRTRAQMEEVLQGLRGALGLIDDLMSFAGSARDENHGRFTPADLLGECLAQASSQIQRSSVVVRSVLGSGSDIRVLGDRAACELLVTALLRGALLGSSSEDVVATVTAEPRGGDRVRLSLRVGGGGGATPAADDRLLELCRGIAERLGGSLQRPEDGGYLLVLELMRHRGAAYDSGIHDPQPLRGRRALVVDDDPALRGVYRTLLRDLGADCDEASDGREALDRCREQHFDLVLMDLNMPRMDGFAATRAIHDLAHESGSEPPPILAITALSDGEAGSRSIAAGAVDCLRKPLQRQQVVAAVHRCINGGLHPRRQQAPQDEAAVFAEDQVQQTLDLMGGGRDAADTLRNLIESYRSATPSMIAELRAAVDVGDGAVERIAHTLKSRSAALGLVQAREAAAEMESLASSGRPEAEPIADLIERFERARAAGLEQLEAFLAVEESS